MLSAAQRRLGTAILAGAIPLGLIACYAIVMSSRSPPETALPSIRISAAPDLRGELLPVIEDVESIVDLERETSVQLTLLDSAATLDAEPGAVLRSPEGFWLKLSKDGIELLATGPRGILNGLITIERLALKEGRLPEKDILERPAHGVRALHFVLRGLTESDLHRLVRSARNARMNTLVVQVADALALNTLRENARSDALTRAEFADFVAFARANGLDVIPEVKLLTHQEKFLKMAYPESMFNTVTYDPQDRSVQALVFAYLEELIELVQPSAIHIGHDEVRQLESIGKRNGLKRGDRPLPASLYLQSVRSLHAFLAEREIETWMWGDMLITPDDFPEMDERNLNGTPEFSSIRESLPRDIVICDWHYYDRKEFPSARLFSDLGFRVVGASWKRPGVARAFSRYVRELPTAHGMMATTWFTVQRGQWDLVDRIVDESGEAYWNGR